MPSIAPTPRRHPSIVGSASAPGSSRGLEGYFAPGALACVFAAAAAPPVETSPTAATASPPRPCDLFHVGASSPGAAESTSPSAAARGLGASPLRRQSIEDLFLASSASVLGVAESTSPAAAATRGKDAPTLLLLNLDRSVVGFLQALQIWLLAQSGAR